MVWILLYLQRPFIKAEVKGKMWLFHSSSLTNYLKLRAANGPDSSTFNLLCWNFTELYSWPAMIISFYHGQSAGYGYRALLNRKGYEMFSILRCFYSLTEWNEEESRSCCIFQAIWGGRKTLLGNGQKVLITVLWWSETQKWLIDNSSLCFGSKFNGMIIENQGLDYIGSISIFSFSLPRLSLGSSRNVWKIAWRAQNASA